MMSYNLKEMVNVASQLKLKLIFCDIDLKTGSMDADTLKKKISSKTLCVVLTNIFSDYETCKKIKLICNKKKIPIIEDNAIYFDNYTKKKKKYFTGSFGDYSLFSFNIMKNISGLYGGCVAFNDKDFSVHCENYEGIKSLLLLCYEVAARVSKNSLSNREKLQGPEIGQAIMRERELEITKYLASI